MCVYGFKYVRMYLMCVGYVCIYVVYECCCRCVCVLCMYACTHVMCACYIAYDGVFMYVCMLFYVCRLSSVRMYVVLCMCVRLCMMVMLSYVCVYVAFVCMFVKTFIIYRYVGDVRYVYMSVM